MRQALILFLLIVLLACPVAASGTDDYTDITDMDQLSRALPSAVGDMIDQHAANDPGQINQSIKRIVVSAIEQSTKTITDVLNMICQIMLAAILCKMVSCDQGKITDRVAIMMGTVAVMLLCLSDVSSMIQTGITTIHEINTFSSVLLPIMASAAAGSGAVNGASVLYTVTVLFSNILISICNKLVIPMINFGLALAATDSLLESSKMKQLRELIGRLIKTGLKWIMYIYTGFLSLSGVLAGSADATALKAAKLAVSGMVPVVGGIISDAADTILTGAGLLKNSVGTFGMLAVLAIFLVPFLKIGVWMIGFRLVSALCSVVESKLSGCLDAISDAMGYILAVIGSCSLMNFLACLSFFKTVSI